VSERLGNFRLFRDIGEGAVGIGVVEDIAIEWQATRTAGGRRIDWRGVDKFRLREGRIAEERVYMDTAVLRAARSLAWPEPLIRLD